MNAVIKADVPGTALVPASLTDAMRLAEIMSTGGLVPRHLQGSPGDCLMVIEQAMRWQMSPFAVAQATSVISGKLMYEGKLVAAAVETSGAITGHLDYTFSGSGNDRAITVSATRRGETSPRSVTVELKEARTANRMWQIQPDQQLVYHGARVWARRWAPAVILGVYSREEMGPIIDAIAEPAAEATPPPAPPPPQDAHEAINKELPLAPDPPPRKRSIGQWLDDLEIALQSCTTRVDYDLIAKSREVTEAQRTLKGAPLNRLWKLLADTADTIDARELDASEADITPDDRLGA